MCRVFRALKSELPFYLRCIKVIAIVRRDCRLQRCHALCRRLWTSYLWIGLVFRALLADFWHRSFDLICLSLWHGGNFGVDIHIN